MPKPIWLALTRLACNRNYVDAAVIPATRISAFECSGLTEFSLPLQHNTSCENVDHEGDAPVRHRRLGRNRDDRIGLSLEREFDGRQSKARGVDRDQAARQRRYQLGVREVRKGH